MMVVKKKESVQTRLAQITEKISSIEKKCSEFLERLEKIDELFSLLSSGHENLKTQHHHLFMENRKNLEALHHVNQNIEKTQNSVFSYLESSGQRIKNLEKTTESHAVFLKEFQPAGIK